MGNIVLLDDLTINKIAAGEVIERPASVVKELVENSIDAGADNIKIEIRNGGITSIRITDNGKGIMNDDLEIAFERHATSKIRKAEDLSEVTSMGFRGEALASIASIAKVTVTTKTKESDDGYKVVVEGGHILEKTETGCPQGTTMLVENLFYNTPVRYKFLKKDFTEAGYVEDVVARIALVNPNIAIKFVNSGKTIIQTSGNGDIKSVIYNIYGRDVAENLIKVDYKFEDTEISGVIGKPAIARSNRANQLFFVNKRFVKDKTLTSAAEQAYKGMLTIGKYGFLVLNLSVNPHKVDVNVHPAKLEVRFEEENIIFKAVYHAIKDNLLKNDLVPGEKKLEEKSQSYEVNSDMNNKKENQSGWLFGRNKNEFGQGNNVIEQIYQDKNFNNRPKYSWDNTSNVIDNNKPVNQIISPSAVNIKESKAEINTQTSSVLEESLRKLREIQQSMKDAGYKPKENVDELIKENNIQITDEKNDSQDKPITEVGIDGTSYQPFMIDSQRNEENQKAEINKNNDNEPKTMNQILQMIEDEKNNLNNVTINDDSSQKVQSDLTANLNEVDTLTDKQSDEVESNISENVELCDETNENNDLNSNSENNESEVDDLVKAKLAELEKLNQTIQDLKRQVELDDEKSKEENIEENTEEVVNNISDEIEQQAEEDKKEEVEEAFGQTENTEQDENNVEENDDNLNEIDELSKVFNNEDNNTDEQSSKEIVNQELLEEIKKDTEEKKQQLENNVEKIEEPKANFEDMYEKLFGTPVHTTEENENIEEKPQNELEDLKTAENISLFSNIPEKINQRYKFIGIAFSTYIIIEMDNEMYIIDQHAAHERIMYEKVKANYYSSTNKNSQLMLLPDIITLTHKEMGIVKDNMQIFEKAGFQLKEFGENTIRLDGVPEVCIDLDTKELFLETLDEINTVARTAKQEIEEKFIATVACKAAVKANMALTKEEVDALMEELLKLPNPFTCPHGRPTAIRMSKIDIEKKFSRR